MEQILNLIETATDLTDFKSSVLEKHEIPNDHGWTENKPHRWSVYFTLRFENALELIIDYRTYIAEDYYKIQGAVYRKFSRV